MWQVIGKSGSICDIKYVQVKTVYGVCTKMESEVALLKRLMDEGLSFEVAHDIIHNEVIDYANDLKTESEID